MEKRKLIDSLGGTCEKAAEKLGFAHRNSVQRLNDTLTTRQEKDILMRLKANRIPYKHLLP